MRIGRELKGPGLSFLGEKGGEQKRGGNTRTRPLGVLTGEYLRDGKGY